MKIFWLLALAFSALPANAQDLKPAPEYFVATIVATTTAENIALACPSLTFDTIGASDRSAEVFGLLAEDGFNVKDLQSSMQDPGDRIRALQEAFLTRHGLPEKGAGHEEVCAAGMAEIADQSELGSYLIETSGDGAVGPTKEIKSD